MRFLLINPFGIGDVLFTTPLIRAIKEKYPNCFLGYWCNLRVKPILENNPFVDRIFALSRGDLKKIFKKNKIEGIKKSLKLFFSLKKEKFDFSVDFSLDHRYGLVSKLVGIKKRVGFNYKNRGRFLTSKLDIAAYENTHIVEHYLQLLKFLEIPPPENIRLELYLSQNDKIWAEKFLEENKIKDSDIIIGVAPCGGLSWGSNAILKHWPAINFINLINKLLKNPNIKIFLFADESEKNITSYIESCIKDERLFNLGGKLSLTQYISLVSKLKLLVTNDSGNLHIAVAVRTKTISIFGPVDELVYGPYPKDEHIVIKKELSCRPCYKNFKFLGCQYNLRCLNDITVDEVYNKVVETLNLRT